MFEGLAVPQYLAWIAILVTVLYWYFTRNHGYWKKVGVRYIKPWPLVGSMILDFKKPLHDSEEERYKKYGRIYGYYEGTKPILSVAEPELMRDILLKDFPSFINRRGQNTVDALTRNNMTFAEGETWKRIRSIVSPTFSTGKLKRMICIFEDCGNTVCKNIEKATKEGIKDIEIKELFGAFSMDVIASSAFSTKLDSHNDPNNQFIQMVKLFFGSGMIWKLTLATLIPILTEVFSFNAFPSRATNFFGQLTLQIIEERKKTGTKRNDFLQLLLDAHTNTEKEENETNNGGIDIDANYLKEGGDEQIINNDYRKKEMSHDEVLAQCILFFIAGYHTTASTITMVSYLLASHPEVQEKVIEEIDQAVQDNEGTLTYEMIQQMRYLDNVISEALRMYPPGIRTERVANDDYKLGNTGITIPKGMVVSFPIYPIHRDPEYYPDPEKFDPDRFSDEERAKRQPYTYLPFGGGPRNCVAMRFALMEVKTCLVCVFSRFRAKVSPKTKVPLEFKFSPFIILPKGIFLEMEVRNDALLKVS